MHRVAKVLRRTSLCIRGGELQNPNSIYTYGSLIYAESASFQPKLIKATERRRKGDILERLSARSPGQIVTYQIRLNYPRSLYGYYPMRKTSLHILVGAYLMALVIHVVECSLSIQEDSVVSFKLC